MTRDHGGRMSKAEFIALIAMMFATIAFSVDAMLPALPGIGAELSPDNPNQAQFIVAAFIVGLGIGTFFTGPLSDAFGRKPVIFWGASVFIGANIVAWLSQSLEVVLAARLVMGLGAAAPRVVALAIVRDLFSGREMARLMSIAMMIFTLVPAIAPLMGAGIISIAGWRSIFLAFALFAVIIVAWMGLRLQEPLPAENRRPFQLPLLLQATRELAAHPVVRVSIMVQTLCYGVLFSMILMVQPVYDQVFDRAESFPVWFGIVALLSGSASLLNAAIVVRVGMRRIVTWTLALQVVLSSAMLVLGAADLPDTVQFGLFIFWQTSVFFLAGMTMGNLNAMAMEPVGHIAGMAASVIGAVSTVLSTLIAAPVGQLFDGTLFPLTAAVLVMCILGWLLMLHLARLEARLPA